MTERIQEEKVLLVERKVTSSAPTELQTVLQGLAQDVKRLGDAHDSRDDQLQVMINGGLSSANNDRVKRRSVIIAMPSDAPWTALPAYAGTWANAVSYQPGQYLMKPGGEVETRGVVSGGAAAHVNDVPEAYAPPNDTYFPVAGAGAVQFFVTSTGGLYLMGGAWVGLFSLAGRWIAAPASQSVKVATPHPFPAPWPIVVNHGWPQCKGLTLENCIEETGGAARGLTGAPIVDWEDIGSGQLRLNAVWGLQWRRRYMLRLLLTREEE